MLGSLLTTKSSSPLPGVVEHVFMWNMCDMDAVVSEHTMMIGLCLMMRCVSECVRVYTCVYAAVVVGGAKSLMRPGEHSATRDVHNRVNVIYARVVGDLCT